MALRLFLKGAILGFSIAAPVGPIGVLCIRRSLADGWRMGLATGLGAATADAAYGAVAALGLTVVSNFLVAQRLWLGVLGGAFLCYLVVVTFLSRPLTEAAQGSSGGLLPAYGSTLLLTITNPMTILSFMAVFAGLGLASGASLRADAALVGGVFVGSAAWWLLVSNGVAMFRARAARWMQAINRVSGIIILAFGVFALSTTLR